MLSTNLNLRGAVILSAANLVPGGGVLESILDGISFLHNGGTWYGWKSVMSVAGDFVQAAGLQTALAGKSSGSLIYFLGVLSKIPLAADCIKLTKIEMEYTCEPAWLHKVYGSLTSVLWGKSKTQHIL